MGSLAQYFWNYQEFPIDYNCYMIARQQTTKRKYKLVLKQTGQYMIFQKQVSLFAELINFDLSANQTNTEDDIIVQIPAGACIPYSHLQIFKEFLQINHYSPQNIGMKKIGLTKKCELGTNTEEFINKTIGALRLEEIQSLIKTARYLSANLFQQVICTYLGNQFIIPLQESEKQKLLEQYQIKKYNKFELAALKNKYKPFFQSYGIELLNQYESKQK